MWYFFLLLILSVLIYKINCVVQLLSHVQVFVTDPMDCSMPGFPALHYLPEFAQIHVHSVIKWLPNSLNSIFLKYQGHVLTTLQFYLRLRPLNI